MHSPYFALSIAMGGIILLVLGVPHLRKVRFERKKKVQDGEKMRAADAEGHTNEVEMEPVAASEKNNRMSIDAGPANGGVSSNELHVRVRQRSQSGFVAAGDSPASSLAAVDDAVQPISPREIVGTLVHAASQQEEHAVLPSPSHNSAAPTDAASSDQHLSPEEAAAVRAHALSLTSEPAIASIEEVDSPSNGKRRLAIHKPKHFPTGEQSDA